MNNIENYKYDCIIALIAIIGLLISYFWRTKSNKTKNTKESKTEESEQNEPDKKDSGVFLPPAPEPVFHIKVAPYSTGGYYYIVFTNNNFLTEFTINNALDLSSWSDELVRVQPMLFSDESMAIEKAEEFNSYEKCISYNKMIEDRYEALMQHYKENPPKKKDVTPSKPAMKETLIY